MFVEKERPKAVACSLNGLSPACIREQVALICQSKDFAHAERLKRFLQFVVEETLSGRGDRLKAYAIALGVFDRDDAFDPQSDPIVRIEASRLRRALEHYYLTDGRNDAILVTIPKGGYAPHAEFRQPNVGVRIQVSPALPDRTGAAPDEPPVAQVGPDRRWGRHLLAAGLALAGVIAVALWGLHQNGGDSGRAPVEPVLLVLPFVQSGDPAVTSLVAAGLTGGLIDTLATGAGLRVMGRETTRWAQSSFSLADLRREYNLSHVLEGDVIATSEKLVVSARLVDTRTNAILWVRRYERAPFSSLSDVQSDIGAQILASFGNRESRGAASPAMVDLLKSGNVGWEDYVCKLKFYQYRVDLTASNHLGLQQCLEQGVERAPRDTDAWAMLSLILIDSLRGANADGGDRNAILANARKAAETAVSLSSSNPRALEALALALYFSRRPTEGRIAADKAIALAPHDAEILGEMGPRIAQAGEWEKGRQLLVQAIEMNPANTGYYAGHLAFIAYMQGEAKTAATLIARTNHNLFATRYLVEALIAAELGDSKGAAEARKRFLELAPGFMARLEDEIAQRNILPADADKLRKGIKKAGF
jgi:TolB-like protein